LSPQRGDNLFAVFGAALEQDSDVTRVPICQYNWTRALFTLRATDQRVSTIRVRSSGKSAALAISGSTCSLASRSFKRLAARNA
jgi:hypothetical protein